MLWILWGKKHISSEIGLMQNYIIFRIQKFTYASYALVRPFTNLALRLLWFSSCTYNSQLGYSCLFPVLIEQIFLEHLLPLTGLARCYQGQRLAIKDNSGPWTCIYSSHSRRIAGRYAAVTTMQVGKR